MNEDPARPPCQDSWSPWRPCCSSLCRDAEAIACFPSVLRADRSVPDIQKRRLAGGKQTYEEILEQTINVSLHLSLTTTLGGEIKRQGKRKQKNKQKERS